ncbi:putative general amidase GmdA [Trichodelitschia bisporula]|uniref:amidase n=1 Tax=Trichodelitschia bisporula TaxID=703511 RepID=A0A6G1HRP3_9PEZI|nr:putative general amidase GmdA [Trichodelitschia bisporula]
MSTYLERGAARRAEIDAAIPEEWRLPSIPSPSEQRDITGPYIWQFLTSREKEITETEAEAIVQNTTSGTWTAVEVTRAFCHRAAIAHQLLNCLHAPLFTAALASAAELDAHLAATGSPVGPLHGLPISLKDQFHVAGTDTSMGYVGWIGTFEGNADDPRTGVFESELTSALRGLGAVIVAKTSVPPSLMAGETRNYIVGSTLSARNRLLSAGGSSGGEGALLGARGSALGWGTDIGGSVRIPAAFNGLYGLKPSTGRMPYEGAANSMDGQNSVLSVVGPLGNSVSALRLGFKAVLSTRPWERDPLCLEIPWREDKAVLPSKLRFGVWKDDGVARVTPPVQRALDVTVMKLQAAGHEVVRWAPAPEFQEEITALLAQVWAFDGGADIHRALGLSGEPPIPPIEAAFGTSARPAMDAGQVAAVNVRIRKVRKGYLYWWQSRGVDAIIAPVAPVPAAREGMYADYGYTMWVNLLDYASVVVPVSKVDKGFDGVVEGYEPRNEQDRICWESYDPEIFDGAPIALQLVGQRLQEEKMLAIADVVVEVLKGYE